MYALKYLHDIGLIHMDLKPDNIMFKSQELKEIVLLDFGLSISRHQKFIIILEVKIMISLLKINLRRTKILMS